ncbi:hypothetical protein SHIRM173S_09082 [Streptomyces hirsutus]
MPPAPAQPAGAGAGAQGAAQAGLPGEGRSGQLSRYAAGVGGPVRGDQPAPQGIGPVRWRTEAPRGSPGGSPSGYRRGLARVDGVRTEVVRGGGQGDGAAPGAHPGEAFQALQHADAGAVVVRVGVPAPERLPQVVAGATGEAAHRGRGGRRGDVAHHRRADRPPVRVGERVHPQAVVVQRADPADARPVLRRGPQAQGRRLGRHRFRGAAAGAVRLGHQGVMTGRQVLEVHQPDVGERRVPVRAGRGEPGDQRGDRLHGERHRIGPGARLPGAAAQFQALPQTDRAHPLPAAPQAHGATRPPLGGPGADHRLPAVQVHGQDVVREVSGAGEGVPHAERADPDAGDRPSGYGGQVAQGPAEALREAAARVLARLGGGLGQVSGHRRPRPVTAEHGRCGSRRRAVGRVRGLDGRAICGAKCAVTSASGDVPGPCPASGTGRAKPRA